MTASASGTAPLSWHLDGNPGYSLIPMTRAKMGVCNLLRDDDASGLEAIIRTSLLTYDWLLYFEFEPVITYHASMQ
jgi:hypothetical protein